MGLRHVLQGQWRADGEPQCVVVCRGGEVGGGLLFGGGGEVVAAEQPDGDVVEQHGPEREARALLAGGVGGDDSVVAGDGGIEVDVVGECHLDDAVDALGGVRADSLGGIWGVQGDSVGDGRVGDVGEVGGGADGADDGGAIPVCELRGESADAAEDAVDQDGLAGDGSVGEHGPV